MSALRLPIARAAVRPLAASQVRLSASRNWTASMLYTTTARNQQKIDNDDIKNPGSSGAFNKDGATPKNNYAVIGGSILVLGAAFWMLLGKPDKVAKEGLKHDPELVKQQESLDQRAR